MRVCADGSLIPLIFFELAAARRLEQFQEKCESVFRPELRQGKELERLAVSVKRRTALASRFAVMPAVLENSAQLFWENSAGVAHADLTARQKKPTSISSIFV